jgi:aryl-alcohol dehydrogenase-like predicted oxidoreductase
LAVAARHGAGVVGRTPLCFGMLSGKVSPETVFDARDHRSLWSKEQIARWIEASSMFVQAVAEKGRQTPAQVALRFCLSYPTMSSTIPGMLQVSEVDENAAASALGPLPADDLAKIVDVYRNNHFFVRKR